MMKLDSKIVICANGGFGSISLYFSEITDFILKKIIIDTDIYDSYFKF